jgi:hypothetical protein
MTIEGCLCEPQSCEGISRQEILFTEFFTHLHIWHEIASSLLPRDDKKKAFASRKVRRNLAPGNPIYEFFTHLHIWP